MILVAMLIIVALSGLGAIAARNVMLELKQVGNYRAGEVALRVAETGIAATMILAVDRGEAFPPYLTATNGRIQLTDIANPFYQFSVNGAPSAANYEQSFGATPLTVSQVNFVSLFSLPSDTNRVPGYPMNEQFIWKQYRVTTSGYYGHDGTGTPTPAEIVRQSTRQYVSDIFIGPYTQGGGGQ
jgi:hypothetical protein